MFWKFCCFWRRSRWRQTSGRAAHDLGQLVGELQRVVVRVHVVGRRPQLPDLAVTAPPCRSRTAGTERRPGRCLERDPVVPLQQDARVLEVVVERRPAVADQASLVIVESAPTRRCPIRPADVRADVRRRQRHDVAGRPPDTARILVVLVVVRDAHVGARAVADVPVEAVLKSRRFGGSRAVDVVIEIVGLAVVRSGYRPAKYLPTAVAYGRCRCWAPECRLPQSPVG